MQRRPAHPQVVGGIETDELRPEDAAAADEQACAGELRGEHGVRGQARGAIRPARAAVGGHPDRAAAEITAEDGDHRIRSPGTNGDGGAGERPSRDRRRPVEPNSTAIGRAQDHVRLRAAGARHTRPDDQRVRRIELDVENLLVDPDAEHVLRPSGAAVLARPHPVLRGRVNLPGGGDLEVEDAPAEKGWHLRPGRSAVGRAVQAAAEAARGCDAGKGEIGVDGRERGGSDVTTEGAERGPDAGAAVRRRARSARARPGGERDCRRRR